MTNLLIRRIFILLFVGTSLFTLEVATEETLLLNLPSHEDVIEGILDKQKQEEELLKDLADTSRDQVQDYQDLFNHSVRHTFIVEFTQIEWELHIQDMIDYNEIWGNSHTDYRSNKFRKVDVTYIADGEIMTIENVGFRSKGNIYSRHLPIDGAGNPRAMHFMLKFNETFDLEESTLAYNDLKTREVFDLEQILFKWNNQNDISFSNEIFAFEMFEEVGVKLPQASYTEVRLVIDGKVEDISFYNIFEHVDEEFIRKNFQDVPTDNVGDLYKGVWSSSMEPIYNSSLYGVRDWETGFRPPYGKETNTDIDDFQNLILFTYGINKSDSDERQEFYENNFDIDNFLRMTAMNVLLGSPDDYRANTNNWYFYFDESDFMTYIPFDYDNSLGCGWTGEPAFIDYTLGNDIYDWGRFPWNNFGTPLIDNLFEYDEYRIMYEDYLMQFIEDGIYSTESYSELFNIANELYGDDFYMENDRANYINAKIAVVTEQVEYYRNLRE